MFEFLSAISIPKLWMAIAATSAVKYFLSPTASIKQNIGAISAGAVIAFFGHTFVLEHVSFFSSEADDTVIIIMLCLSGEHICRAIMQITPQKITEIIAKRFTGK